eukprot:6181938-Amphidinium_carterae.1
MRVVQRSARRSADCALHDSWRGSAVCCRTMCNLCYAEVHSHCGTVIPGLQLFAEKGKGSGSGGKGKGKAIAAQPLSSSLVGFVLHSITGQPRT